jgi:Xaa-Pro aminopeptidase
LTKIPQEVVDHLSEVTIAEYDQMWVDLAALSADASVSAIFLPGDDRAPGCSFAVYSTVAEGKRLVDTPPTLINKARKNSIEISQMRDAIITDGVALTRFLAFLEAEITAGNVWTEVSAQERLTEYRMFHGARDLSFGTISGYGEHGAIIHYEATNETDVVIGTTSLYLLDSGGQYFGATTDVTRTMHYGEPSAEEIEMYTRVLMGNIDFGALVFPRGTLKSRIDVLARRPIWSEGLDYRHGTSHGIGMYLNVHEAYLDAFDLGYVCSDEPGYYKDGEYGIRIEDQVTVVDAGLFFDEPFYKIDMMTMVPYEPKLIDVSIMTDEQVAVLNERNARTRATVGAMLQDQGYTTEYQWLLGKTEPLSKTSRVNPAVVS